MKPILLSPVANHLWQSTLFAVAAWLLTVALRKNYARVRHGVWLAASCKFLIPVSMLIALGGQVRWRTAPVMTQSVLYVAVDHASQPFASSATEAPASREARDAAIPVAAILFGIWACGFAGIGISWWIRWRRIRAVVRDGSLLHLDLPVPVMSSPALIEPGVFGVFRPVLLLPEGIADHLTPAQLDAVIAHELCHVRHRDNLIAAFHMFVETVFWFHPLVWWIGKRMVEERERACDEAVLQSSRDAKAYAEGILNVCKTYVGSPLPCLSGVSGATLKERIVRIMTEQTGRKLDPGRIVLLSAAAVTAVGLPITLGLVHATQVRAQSAPANPARNIAATWQGTLHTGRDLRFVIKITNADNGTLLATFHNIDGRPGGIPAISTALNGSLLKVDLPFGTYEGTVSADGNSITGTWTQGSNPLPLNLARATPDTEWTIPQPPPRLPPMAADANPTFEVATVKPSGPDEHGPRFDFRSRRFSVIHASLGDLLRFSYGLQQSQIAKAQDWVNSESYDISAEPDGEGEPSIKQWESMVKKLMADRFQLKYHFEKREQTVYVLTVAKNGPKLTRSKSDPSAPGGLGFGPPGNFGATNATMADIAEALGQGVLNRPVVDQTGLTGRFDLRLTWTPDGPQPATESADALPDIFTAIEEKLGLRLVSTKAPVDFLVIDHVERPSAN